MTEFWSMEINLGTVIAWISGLLLGVAYTLLMPLSKNAKKQETKISVRYVRRETQWPNFTWIRVEPPLLKPSEKKK